MIQVLGYVAHQEICKNCDAILSFHKSDIKVEGTVEKDKYIECPNCHGKVYVSRFIHS